MARGALLPHEDIIRLAGDGYTIHEIAFLTKREDKAIRNHLRRAGVPYKHVRGDCVDGYAARFRRYRTVRGLTQMELAIELDKSIGTIRHYEHGRRRIPGWIVDILEDWEKEVGLK